MSKRCDLQKKYYKKFGNYKGDGKYSDDYVKWLENEVLALRIHGVVGRSEQLTDANKRECNCSNATDRLDCGFECYNK